MVWLVIWKLSTFLDQCMVFGSDVPTTAMLATHILNPHIHVTRNDDSSVSAFPMTSASPVFGAFLCDNTTS